MLIVAALGGNALLRRCGPTDAAEQMRNVARAANALAGLAQEHSLVVTHGNGPQIGMLALQAELSRVGEPYPLDVLGAETEGMIGYMLERAMRERLPEREAATLLTQVLVDADDPAFASPSKPIGPVYDAETARRLAAERGFAIAPDGSGWRRVVPSPQPLQIVELSAISLLLDAGAIVICGGGGGIPVAAGAEGALHGMQAVIDKDRCAALLARELDADALLLLTDVANVELGHGTEHAEAIGECTVAELDPSRFEEGSMRPKVEAAREFAAATGRTAGIGALQDAAEILAGRRGTRVHPDVHPLETERAVRRLAERTAGLEHDAQELTRMARRAAKPLSLPPHPRHRSSTGRER